MRDEKAFTTPSSDGAAVKKSANQVVYSQKEEWINRITHLLGAVASLVGAVLLIIKTVLSGEGARATLAVSIYSVALLLLYVMSTLYHFQPVGKTSRAVFRRFDHCSISVLIAGTYAPFAMLEMYSHSKVWATVIFVTVIAMAVLSIVFNAIDVNRFKVFSLISYVLMGWACIVRIDLVLHNVPAFIYLLAGGVAYTVGIIFYRIKRIPYNHAIWHIFVLVGSALHFVSVYFYLIP